MIKLQTDSNDEWQGFNKHQRTTVSGLSELISGKGQNKMSMNGQGMRGLVGREVKINRGGPDSIQGTLMDVRWDYMAVSCKEGMVYVNDAHVKSITDTGRSGGARGPMGNPIPANTFLGVMQALRFRPVQINREDRKSGRHPGRCQPESINTDYEKSGNHPYSFTACKICFSGSWKQQQQ